MRIGVAEYAEGPTGTTVLHFPERAKAAVDVRGGFPGTFNVDMLPGMNMLGNGRMTIGMETVRLLDQ